MKLAITSQGQGLDSQVDPRFGRAAYILIVDTVNHTAERISGFNRNEVMGRFC